MLQEWGTCGKLCLSSTQSRTSIASLSFPPSPHKHAVLSLATREALSVGCSRTPPKLSREGTLRQTLDWRAISSTSKCFCLLGFAFLIFIRSPPFSLLPLLIFHPSKSTHPSAGPRLFVSSRQVRMSWIHGAAQKTHRQSSQQTSSAHKVYDLIVRCSTSHVHLHHSIGDRQKHSLLCSIGRFHRALFRERRRPLSDFQRQEHGWRWFCPTSLTPMT